MYKIKEFKGHKIITLSGNNKFFSFGIRKAKLILENIDAIRSFVEKFDTGD